MEIQQRLLRFITSANWVLLIAAGVIGASFLPTDFALGVIFGGLIVTVNFHLLYRTLKKAFANPGRSTHNVVLAKYYVRFLASAVIIFFLISQHIVDPIGLFIGLSVVVLSIITATVLEVTKLFSKEAT